MRAVPSVKLGLVLGSLSLSLVTTLHVRRRTATEPRTPPSRFTVYNTYILLITYLRSSTIFFCTDDDGVTRRMSTGR